jgi:uncharacterized protein YbjT (DUF2867 family)
VSDKPVLLIGATRSTGLLAARVLQQQQVPVRILARNPAAARETIGRDVEIVSGDVTKKDTLVSAFHGVSHLVFTAGVRSGRFAREAIVKATEYDGVLNTIAAARLQDFRGRFVYMTSIGVTRRSMFASALNVWKGNTLLWRRRAEDAIRSSGLDYAVVRVAFLLNRPAHQRAIQVSQDESPLTFRECLARGDAAEALVEALFHPNTARTTFEIKWAKGPRRSNWSALFSGLKSDEPDAVRDGITAA